MSPRELPEPRYYDDPADWDRIIGLARGRRVGWDTEFYGVDLRSKDSTDTCPHKAKVHVWSIGIPTKILHPRGYYRAVSAVFPVAAFARESVRVWLRDHGSVKVALNAPVDVHATEHSSGLEVAGVVDLLSLSRWIWPQRVAPGPGFSLDALGSDILGRPKADSFEEVLGEPNVVSVRRQRTTTRNVCECGSSPCRKRKGPGHTRSVVKEVEEWHEDVVRGTRLIPLETVVPGHPRFPRLVKYSGVDSELAAELDQVLLRDLAKRKVVVPW